MATPSAKPGVNGVSSPGGSTPSHTRDWGALRSGEPGSAFRGLTKGRGGDRGGRRSGRGGRGSRAGGSLPSGRGGGDQANATKPEPNPVKVDVPTEPKATPAAGASTSPVEKGTTPTATNEKAPKPRGSSRKSSRNVPTLILPPSSPTLETTPAATPARQGNRRRRSQQRRKSPTTTTPSPKLSVDPSPNPNLLRPQRARTGPPSPVISTKDVPPHLSAGPHITTFDMKHNIDALVERVRAVAMDNNRPTTPGSHIDWAGDDDDSLPDLDDWGVTTSTSVAEDRIEISPILVDGLKPLPEPTVRVDNDREEREVNTAPVVDVVPQIADKAPPHDEKWKSKRFPRALQVDSKAEVSSKPIKFTDTAAQVASASERTNLHVPADVSPTSSSEPPLKASLHPSLPAKPVAAVQNLVVQAKLRPGAMPMRVSVPVKQPVIVDKPPESTQLPVAAVEKTAPPVEQPSKTLEKPLTSVVVTDTLPQLIVAPPTAEPSPEVNSSTEDSSEKAGMAASIHAPLSLPESASSLNLVQPIPTAPRAFNPTHQRAHTVGRVQQFNQLQTPPGFQQRFSRSGTSTPRGGYGTHVTHSRTHSSPPTGSGLNPRVHTQRPVITVDAISRLARTIGGIPPPRAQEVSITKE
ncbi:hypothetical protein PILCRDRAFT_811509 [Piloderma croceum F 1598]|uniref:Uncharacterized protein n=1 Tax=Piloderma croceum (strain F 1598) TaxID=765440 RepID=A0A0C3CMU9_PILCF|nr:hypothetical protein PILCRDRAFT_811509 [Piloderma croceum F 1598]